MTNIKLKEAFEVESKHGAFYTGGNVEWYDNRLYCQGNAAVSIIEVETGTVVKTIGEEESDIADTIQTFTTNGLKTVTSHKSSLLKLWNLDGEVEKMWRYIHNGPIAALRLIDNVLYSGGSDGVVRKWDLIYQACTLALKGNQGVVNVVEVQSDLIFTSGDDGKINSYNVNTGELETIYNGHFSKVTAVVFHHDGKHIVSSGRDKVLILWEIGKGVALKTLPVYEGIESLISFPEKINVFHMKLKTGILVASGGENGIIRIWDVSCAKEIYAQTNSLITKATDEGGLAINKVLYNQKTKSLAVVGVEQNIILHKLKTFEVLKQFVGFSDEIYDIAYYGQNETHLAVATNSNDIKLYENATMDCQLLKGHTDLVLTLQTAAFNLNLLISGSKDHTVRFWLLENNVVQCVGIGMRHTGSVSSVAFGHSDKFAASVSQDTCLKLWSIPEKFEPNMSIQCTFTESAHDKDINSVSISPNDKIIATCSLDKTTKLWTENLSLLGVLKGHRRGVWCARFSPVDQVILTSSADCTIKLWSIADLSCLKTITGHESSVTKAEFLSNGMQILSAGGDGLLKLFNLKTSECISTMEDHGSRIWALAVKRDQTTFITGGTDSTLIKWKDVTEDRKLEKIKEMEEQALEEQELSNYIHNDDLLKALKLALKLGKPLKVLRVIQSVIKKGDTGLADTIKSLSNDQKESLLKCTTDWNTNSRNCHPAQLVLNILLNELQSREFKPLNLREVIEGALPYTERHFKRMTQMMQDLNFINYTINCMQPHAKIT